MKLKLRVNCFLVVDWCIAASYTKNDDCRGHTGTMMSLGNGAILSSYLKQKLNMKRYIEGELLGAHYVMSIVFCSNHLIESQQVVPRKK